ncbi:MAG: type I restriction endonuclease subunit R [Desulfobacteraceae bacterium]|nr:type I restriction endonuclease subunit R [Pseudomonadota bacterium]MCG2756889.1 type I restriction endonuclease subunit R [Desulfobacteraceae bacterium]
MYESDIEQLTLEKLQAQEYEYIYGPTIAPDGEHPERQTWDDVILPGRFKHAVHTLNPSIPDAAREQAIREVLHITSPELINNNETFHRYLTDGIEVEFQKDGITRGDKVWLVDFEHPENNEFLVVNQYTVIENNINKRPDVVLFVNGLPLVVIELKNPADENATVKSAFNQMQTYKAMIPSLFTCNAMLVISDGLEARAGSLSAGYSRFVAWKSREGKTEASSLISQLEVLVKGMLNKRTLLDLIRHFTVFEKTKREDPETGQTFIESIKKVAAYHQYYAVNKAVNSTIDAASADGGRKGGVIWHTQGSGKSLSMVFYSGKLVLSLDNPTIIVITDRNDLDDQLFDTFAASRQLLRQEPVQANNRDDLREKLKVASGGIVFTTIQKFSPDDGEIIYPLLSERKNIVVIADEAHRSQYGFKAKTIDVKDENGNIIGKRTAYGFAKYVRDALPNATFIGFTGTPIELTDRNTPAVFGSYVDIYDISQAQDDRATVKIYYESRLAKVNLTEEGRKLIKDLDKELEQEDLTVTQQAKAKWTKLEAIVGSPDRLKNVARDALQHFEQRQEVFKGKAMFVTMSRRIAVAMYNEIIRLHPAWHNDDLKKGAVKIVMTAASSDGPVMAKHHTTKDQRRQIADRFKDPEDPLELVIVCDMWLTGFDVPCLHTMYFDKPMKGHTLMQAIARVNRVYLDKPGGLIVDYIGIATDLKKALSVYSQSGGKGKPAEMQEQAVELMLEKLEVMEQFYKGFDYQRYFKAETSEKLSIILQAEEHILNLENGKARYINEVTVLSKTFALAIPHEQALLIKEKVAFFQAVKARLQKFETTSTGKTTEEIETAIRQVVDKAITSDKIVDIFEAAGIAKPDISILSDEFLSEIKGMKRKNLAFELLKKLLKDEIQARVQKNIIQSKKLMEMLENAIRRYQNNLITAAEVIDELIKLARDIKISDARGEETGMSEYEQAFYDALANNESAREVMGDDKLRELAIVLVDRIKNNASIDWSIKESVRARMKVLVKRLLRQYGYPPDKQVIATETVLQQAELFTDDWVKATLESHPVG